MRVLGQHIGDGERRHHGEPGVADLAEFRAQALDPGVEVAGELHEVAFLAVLAGHAELPAVDGDADLGHCPSPERKLSSTRRPRLRSAAGLEHAADGFDRLIDALRHLAIGGFQRRGVRAAA